MAEVDISIASIAESIRSSDVSSYADDFSEFEDEEEEEEDVDVKTRSGIESLRNFKEELMNDESYNYTEILNYDKDDSTYSMTYSNDSFGGDNSLILSPDDTYNTYNSDDFELDNTQDSMDTSDIMGMDKDSVVGDVLNTSSADTVYEEDADFIDVAEERKTYIQSLLQRLQQKKHNGAAQTQVPSTPPPSLSISSTTLTPLPPFLQTREMLEQQKIEDANIARAQADKKRLQKLEEKQREVEEKARKKSELMLASSPGLSALIHRLHAKAAIYHVSPKHLNACPDDCKMSGTGRFPASSQLRKYVSSNCHCESIAPYRFAPEIGPVECSDHQNRPRHHYNHHQEQQQYQQQQQQQQQQQHRQRHFVLEGRTGSLSHAPFTAFTSHTHRPSLSPPPASSSSTSGTSSPSSSTLTCTSRYSCERCVRKQIRSCLHDQLAPNGDIYCSGTDSYQFTTEAAITATTSSVNDAKTPTMNHVGTATGMSEAMEGRRENREKGRLGILGREVREMRERWGEGQEGRKGREARKRRTEGELDEEKNHIVAAAQEVEAQRRRAMAKRVWLRQKLSLLASKNKNISQSHLQSQLASHCPRPGEGNAFLTNNFVTNSYHSMQEGAQQPSIAHTTAMRAAHTRTYTDKQHLDPLTWSLMRFQANVSNISTVLESQIEGRRQSAEGREW